MHRAITRANALLTFLKPFDLMADTPDHLDLSGYPRSRGNGQISLFTVVCPICIKDVLPTGANTQVPMIFAPVTLP